VRARRGDPGADVLIAEADTLARPTGELPRMGLVAAAQAELAWLSGRPGEIAALTDESFALAATKHAPRILGELARWRARSGGVDKITSRLPKPDALELAGEYLGAATGWAALGCPYESALARAHADDAQSLRHALDELRELGALPASRIVAQRLRLLGARGIIRGPRRATRENAAGLTGRELDVLRLLTDGLSNADIAERLFLSRRTVDHHVSAILRKLVVNSRSAAVSATAKRGLLKDA
jgi:DNA-binding CsgD family transcriptional regulator